MAEALDWLKNKRYGEKPFLLIYQPKAPHRNWQPDPKSLTKYNDVAVPEPETVFDNYEGRARWPRTLRRRSPGT